MLWCGTRYAQRLTPVVDRCKLYLHQRRDRYNLDTFPSRRASGLLEPSREPERPAARLQMESFGRSPGYDRRYRAKLNHIWHLQKAQ